MVGVLNGKLCKESFAGAKLSVLRARKKQGFTWETSEAGRLSVLRARKRRVTHGKQAKLGGSLGSFASGKFAYVVKLEKGTILRKCHNPYFLF